MANNYYFLSGNQVFNYKICILKTGYSSNLKSKCDYPYAWKKKEFAFTCDTINDCFFDSFCRGLAKLKMGYTNTFIINAY
jgi:hypothetical protein